MYWHKTSMENTSHSLQDFQPDCNNCPESQAGRSREAQHQAKMVQFQKNAASREAKYLAKIAQLEKRAQDQEYRALEAKTLCDHHLANLKWQDEQIDDLERTIVAKNRADKVFAASKDGAWVQAAADNEKERKQQARSISELSELNEKLKRQLRDQTTRITRVDAIEAEYARQEEIQTSKISALKSELRNKSTRIRELECQIRNSTATHSEADETLKRNDKRAFDPLKEEQKRDIQALKLALAAQPKKTERKPIPEEVTKDVAGFVERAASGGKQPEYIYSHTKYLAQLKENGTQEIDTRKQVANIHEGCHQEMAQKDNRINELQNHRCDHTGCATILQAEQGEVQAPGSKVRVLEESLSRSKTEAMKKQKEADAVHESFKREREKVQGELSTTKAALEELKTVHARCNQESQKPLGMEEDVDMGQSNDADPEATESTENVQIREQPASEQSSAQPAESDTMHVDSPEQAIIDRLELENEQLRRLKPENDRLHKEVDDLRKAYQNRHVDEMGDTPMDDMEDRIRTEIERDFRDQQAGLQSLIRHRDDEIQKLKWAATQAATNYQTALDSLQDQQKKASDMDFKLAQRESELKSREESLKRGDPGSSSDRGSRNQPTTSSGKKSGSQPAAQDVQKLTGELKSARAHIKMLKKAAQDDRAGYERMDTVLMNRDRKAAQELRDAEGVRRELGAEIDALKEKLADMGTQLEQAREAQATDNAGAIQPNMASHAPASSPETAQIAAATASAPEPSPASPTAAAGVKRAHEDDAEGGESGGSNHAKKVKADPSLHDASGHWVTENRTAAAPTASNVPSEQRLQIEQDEQMARRLMEQEVDLREARDGKKKE